MLVLMLPGNLMTCAVRVLLVASISFLLLTPPSTPQATGSKTAQKGSVEVVGATCPALDSTGHECCSEPIPWVKLLESSLFMHMHDRALAVYQNEMLNKRIQESPFLHSCPGTCNRVVVLTHPPTNASNEIQCDKCNVRTCVYVCMHVCMYVCMYVSLYFIDADIPCPHILISLQISFCFKCRGQWYESHVPATCGHMVLWGASVFGAGDTNKQHDSEFLSRMEIFRSTVGCPGVCVL